MLYRKIGVFPLFALTIALAACSSKTTGGGSGGGGGAGGSGSGGGSGAGGGSGGSGALQWYTTCGDPVCSGHMPQAGVDPCTNEAEGAACGTAGSKCDPGNDCNALLLCADADPKLQPGGCPISRARYKRDIKYLDDSAIQRVHDDLMTMPLATWHYRSEKAAAREHLGIIIDDAPQSPAVAASGEYVDLYGYTSMAVAAIKAQQKQIDALNEEVRALRKELAASRGKAQGETK